MEENLLINQTQYYQSFLTSCLIVCFVMVGVWLCRIKTKRKNAWIMSLAFTIMGFLIYTLKMELNPFWTKGLIIVLAMLLLADVWIRTANYKKN